ncbi:hypothetical protein ACN6K8_005524, partial [[Kitasatospora] papulosa]|uniref:hypothetical protein n=1 Tax=[Kitasatospora] papulosa TaxID=1464011 RepID=UPI00403CD788
APTATAGVRPMAVVRGAGNQYLTGARTSDIRLIDTLYRRETALLSRNPHDMITASSGGAAVPLVAGQ